MDIHIKEEYIDADYAVDVKENHIQPSSSNNNLLSMRKEELGSLMLKRRIRTDCKRWSKEDKNFLLQIIGEETYPLFEKPTAQIYYGKIIQKYPHFNGFGWKAMRDKMRNLKLNYTKAIDWRSQAESAIDGENAESTIRQHMLKLCEDFDVLSDLFGAKTYIPPLYLHESQNSAGDEGTGAEPTYKYIMVKSPEETQIVEDSSPPTSTATCTKKRRLQNSNNATNYQCEVQKEKTSYLREKLKIETAIKERTLAIEEGRRKIEEEKFSFFKIMEERKLRLEEEKVALDRTRFEEEFRLKEIENERTYNLNKIRLENEMRLKELELKLRCKYSE